MKVHAQAFEQSLTKIYIFMDDPKSISFEDDIIHIMQAYIKRQKTISPVIWQLFLKLPAVLDKNKHQLKDLFDTVNLFLIEGKAGFTQEVQAVRIVAELANTAMVTQMPSQTINNVEGCLLYQAMF